MSTSRGSMVATSAALESRVVAGLPQILPCQIRVTSPLPLPLEARGRNEKGACFQALHEVELGGFEPPTSWVRSGFREKGGFAVARDGSFCGL